MPITHQNLHFQRRASCKSPLAGRVGGVTPEPHSEFPIVEARATHHAAPLLVMRAVWCGVPSAVLVRARRGPRVLARRAVAWRRIWGAGRDLAAGGAPALVEAERLERTACVIEARIARTPAAPPARAQPRGAEAKANTT